MGIQVQDYSADDTSRSPGLGEMLHLFGIRIRGVTRPPRSGTCCLCGCVLRVRKSEKTSTFGLKCFLLVPVTVIASWCLSGIAFLSVW